MPITQPVVWCRKNLFNGIFHCKVAICYNWQRRFTIHCNKKLFQQPYICIFGFPRYYTSRKNNGLIMMINTWENNKRTIVLVLPICCIEGQNISKYLIVHTTFTVTPEQTLKPPIIVNTTFHKHKRIVCAKISKIINCATGIRKQWFTLLNPTLWNPPKAFAKAPYIWYDLIPAFRLRSISAMSASLIFLYAGNIPRRVPPT